MCVQPAVLFYPNSLSYTHGPVMGHILLVKCSFEMAGHYQYVVNYINQDYRKMCLLLTHGLPQKLVTDNGLSFTSEGTYLC